jgi:two-component system sensor histidine kinase/response regulator
MLGAIGFSVQAAADGAETLALFESWNPHLVLLDMVMPGVDGCEAARRIKSTASGRAVPVVMVSASALDDHRSKAAAAGADGFLRKPLREEVVLEEIRRLLGVKYTYGDEDTGPRKGDSAPGELDVAALRRIPAALRAALCEAVEGGYMDAIAEHVDEAERHDPRIGAALRELAQGFKYDSLLALLARAEGR